MNIGYIYNILTKELKGIIAHNKQYISYYSDDDEIKDIITLILQRRQIPNLYSTDKEIICENTDTSKESYLHGFSYMLPYPYHIDKLEYKKITPDKIYNLYMEAKNEKIS